jgi:TPR repeat protein
VGTDQDLAQSIKYLQLAVDQNLPEAYRNLGWSYMKGTGVEKDQVKGAQYTKIAADKGIVGAQSNMGLCYDSGWGVQAYGNRAFYYYKKAADQGSYAYAQLNLGNLYKLGKWIKNDKLAVHYFKLGAVQNDPSCLCNLAWYYIRGIVLPKDEKKAFDAFTQANVTDKTNSTGLGWCYLRGIGVPKDEIKAFNYFQVGSNAGDGSSQYYLGTCYDLGIGTEKNPPEAARNYIAAVTTLEVANSVLGDEIAQNCLGECYEYGRGVEKNIPKAIELYQRSAKQGHIEAINNLARLKMNKKNVA